MTATIISNFFNNKINEKNENHVKKINFYLMFLVGIVVHDPLTNVKIDQQLEFTLK